MTTITMYLSHPTAYLTTRVLREIAAHQWRKAMASDPRERLGSVTFHHMLDMVEQLRDAADLIEQQG